MKLSKDIKNELKEYLKAKLAHTELKATIIAACPLSETDVKKIKAKVNLISNLPVEVVVDESILAGFRIKVGSKLIDYSLKTKVDKLFTV